MSKKRSKLAPTLVALTIYPLLSFTGYTLLWAHVKASTPLNAPQPCPTFQSITSVPAIDKILCVLTGAFQLLLAKDPARTSTLQLLSDIMPTVIAIYGAYARAEERWTSWLGVVPLAMGIAMQIVGGAVMVPWMCLILFFFTGRDTNSYTVTQRDPNSGGKTKVERWNISEHHARSVLFGTTFGLAIPSLLMALYGSSHPWIITAWQPFPLYIELFLRLYQFFAPRPDPAYESGHETLTFGIQLSGLMGALIRGALLFRYWRAQPDQLLPYLIPSISPIPRSQYTPGLVWNHFIQWDDVVISTTGLLTAALFAWRDTGSVLKFFVVLGTIWVPFLAPFGFAVAVAKAWVERELVLKEEVAKEKVLAQQKKN